jgi:hypothetical protein
MNEEPRKDLFSIGVPFVAGGVVFLLLAFGTGIITATSTARMSASLARIDERASMCFDAATAFLATAQGQAAGPITREFAEKFSIASGNRTTDTMVQDQCRKKLGV